MWRSGMALRQAELRDLNTWNSYAHTATHYTIDHLSSRQTNLRKTRCLACPEKDRPGPPLMMSMTGTHWPLPNGLLGVICPASWSWSLATHHRRLAFGPAPRRLFQCCNAGDRHDTNAAHAGICSADLEGQ
eukprot:73506-Chlamydomonas_euryale.AAC.4